MENYVSVKKDKLLHAIKRMNLIDIDEGEEGRCKRALISDSICLRFQSRQNKSVVMKGRMVIIFGGREPSRGLGVCFDLGGDFKGIYKCKNSLSSSINIGALFYICIIYMIYLYIMPKIKSV